MSLFAEKIALMPLHLRPQSPSPSLILQWELPGLEAQTPPTLLPVYIASFIHSIGTCPNCGEVVKIDNIKRQYLPQKIKRPCLPTHSATQCVGCSPRTSSSLAVPARNWHCQSDWQSASLTEGTISDSQSHPATRGPLDKSYAVTNRE